MIYVNTSLPKLCHARPGDVVRLPDPQSFDVLPDVYLVAVFNEKGKRACRMNSSYGLYTDERPIFLVNLKTGEAIPMPHLSSRVEIVRDIAVVEGYKGDEA